MIDIEFRTKDETAMPVAGEMAMIDGAISVYTVGNEWQELTPAMESLESKVDRLEKVVEKLVQQLAPELGV